MVKPIPPIPPAPPAPPRAAAPAAEAPDPIALAVAATERMQLAAQDAALQATEAAKAAEQAAADAKQLLAEAAEGHNAVIGLLEAESAARDGTPAAAPALPAMTAAEAARLVRRRKVIEAPGAQPRVIESPIGEDEVLAFKDHGTHVVVVTVDGQKFSTAD